MNTYSLKDDKNRYSKSVLLDCFSGLTISGNTLEGRTWNANDEISENSSFDASIEYNSDSYPTTIVHNFLDGYVESQSYEYY